MTRTEAEQVRAIRYHAAAQVAMCDALLYSLEVGGDVPIVAVQSGGAVCPHPHEQRIEARRMGHPNAFVCAGCGEESE